MQFNQILMFFDLHNNEGNVEIALSCQILGPSSLTLSSYHKIEIDENVYTLNCIIYIHRKSLTISVSKYKLACENYIFFEARRTFNREICK